jgi:hypothetical protein
MLASLCWRARQGDEARERKKGMQSSPTGESSESTKKPVELTRSLARVHFCMLAVNKYKTRRCHFVIVQITQG